MRFGRVQGLVATVAVGTVLAALAGGSAATARDEESHVVTGRLSGYQETPVALSTNGTGQIRIRVDDDEIAYRLSYANLEGSVTQAHIHLGARGQSGGVSAFLCTNLGNSPGMPACPLPAQGESGTLSGIITPAHVVGPASQGIAPGEFDELVRAIRAGVTYVNVHTSLYPSGEIRAQLHAGRPQ